jgi:antitoxin HigA-1
MSEMHNPPRPGLTLRDDVLPALGLQVTEAARQSDGLRSRLPTISGRHANRSRSQRHWPE